MQNKLGPYLEPSLSSKYYRNVLVLTLKLAKRVHFACRPRFEPRLLFGNKPLNPESSMHM